MKLLRREKTTAQLAKEIAKVSKAPIKKKSPVEFISTGSNLLNLAASQRGETGGWARGRIINLVGDGSSGKTLLALEAAAHAYHNLVGNKTINFPKVKKLIIVYNNVEEVMDFPLGEMYGEDFVKAVEWISSSDVEAFGRDYTRRVLNLKPGEFLLYILDSYDSLGSEKERAAFIEAAKKDKEAETGSYGLDKASYGSKKFFKNMCGIMAGKDTTLMIISQVREKIGSTFKEKYRAGGKALDFYTHQVCWLAVVEKLKRTYRGKEKIYGVRVRANFKRSKVSKPFRQEDVIILFDYGLDNLATNLAWLYGPSVKKLTWDEEEYTRPKLIKYIEENHLEEELSARLEEEWLAIEEVVKPHRKKRWGG